MNYLCSACKDKKGWCKNWDGTCTKKDMDTGLFKSRATDCKLEPTTCGFYVVGKPREPLGGK